MGGRDCWEVIGTEDGQQREVCLRWGWKVVVMDGGKARWGDGRGRN